MRWLLQHHRDKIDAAYALNEGGGGSLRNWKPLLHSVQATEKVPVNFQIKVTKAFFERTAQIEVPEYAAAMKALTANPNDAAAAATLSKQPRYSSMLRTSCVATRLFGGHADNALPQLATANVNCRVAPNVVPAEVREQLVRLFNDPQVEISAAPALAPSAPSLAELMEPVEALTRQVWLGTPVIPTMSTGATDGRYLREQGHPHVRRERTVRRHGRQSRPRSRRTHAHQVVL